MQKGKLRIVVFSVALILFSGVFSVISFGQSFSDCENDCTWKKELCYQECYGKYDSCMVEVQALIDQLNYLSLTPEERSALEAKIREKSFKCLNKQIECESECYNKYVNCVDICYYNQGGYGDPDNPDDPLNPNNPCNRKNNPSHWCPPECAMCI